MGTWDRLHTPVDIHQQLAEVSGGAQRERLSREFGFIEFDEDPEYPASASGMTPAVLDLSAPVVQWPGLDLSWLSRFEIIPSRPTAGLPLVTPVDRSRIGPGRKSARRVIRPPTRVKERRQPGCLTEQEVGAQYDAVSFLNREYGLVLNAFITIVYALLGIKDHRAAATLLWRYNHDARIWLRRQKMSHHYVYVHEDAVKHGYHSHQLAYVPREQRKEFRRWTRQFFARHCGPNIPKEAVDIKYKIPGGSASQQVAWQWERLRYMCKELDPGVWARGEDGREYPLRELLQLPEWSPGRAVRVGQRCGGSHGIWRAAQMRPGVKVPIQWSHFNDGVWSELYSGWELSFDPKTWVHMSLQRAWSRGKLMPDSERS